MIDKERGRFVNFDPVKSRVDITAGTVSKRIKISSNFFLGLVAKPHRLSNTTHDCEILTGRGACHWGGLAPIKSRMVAFWYQLTQVFLKIKLLLYERHCHVVVEFLVVLCSFFK